MKNSILGKARWLRDVALATSKNNGARVAHEWLKYAAMFVMLFTIGSGNVWGADATFNSFSGLGSSSYSSGSTTSSSITLASSGWYGAKATELRIKSGATVTISCTSNYKITKIVFIATGADYAKLKSPVAWSGTTGTYTNDLGTTSVTFSNSAQCRFSSIVVTYTADCTTNPTVSAGSNSNVTATTATVSCSGISSLGSSAGCSITSYGFVYGTSSNPTTDNTIVEVGTTYTTTGTAFSKELTGLTANTTYYVRPYATNGNGTAYGTQTSFTTPALPKYTVNWYVNGSIAHSQTGYEGATLTGIPTPTSSDCDGSKVFVGWYTSTYSHASTAPAYVSPTTIPNGGANYYAVFADATPSTDYKQITAEGDLVAGAKYLIVGYKSSVYKALPVDAATSLTTVTVSSSTISNPESTLIWTLEGSADAWKIKSTNNNKYLQISSGSLTFENSTSLTFSVDVSSSIFKFTSSAASGNKVLSYYANQNKFNAYSSANTVYVFKQKITYSNYEVNCCTPPASPLSITGGNTVSMDATLSPGTSGGNGGTVTWSVTSGTGTATINSSTGVLTPGSVGTVTIHAHQDQKGTTCPQDAELVVTIVSATVNVSSVSVSPTSKSIIPGETFTITPTVSPANATDKTVSWTSSVTSKATVTSAGVVTGEAAGSSTITCTTTDGGKTATCAVMVYGVTLQARDEDGNAIADGGPGAPTRSGTTITAAANAGNYVFKEWQVTNATAASTTTSPTTISNPTNSVTVTAVYYKPINVTWKVSGSADNKVVYDHGDALVLPSNPSAPTACSEKRFVGWKEGAIDGSTDDRPTMLNPSSPGTVTADKTYYAVFADEGTTFTKVTDPSTFMAGDKIAIVSNDNSYGLRISSNAPAATASTISDATTITPASDMVWTLAGNSTDGFTMSTASRTSEGAVTLGAASVPSSNSSADVSLNSSNNTWKFSAHNTSNCILITRSNSNSTGLEYYKSSWKIYTNSGVASNAFCAMRVYRKNLSGYVTTCSECMTPSDLEISSITSTGATVTWAGVSQTQQAGGSGTGYKVAWNMSNSVPSPLNASNSADVATGTNTYDITGLTAATQYYVFVQSKCDDSWSSSTNFYTNAKITYAAGAGLGSMDPKEVTYNTDATVDACTFTAPSGKKFNGWVSDQSVTVSASSTTSVPDGATITGLTKAITLTAQWRDLASYTVNFSADNGTVAGGTAQTVYEEGKLTFPNVTSTTCGTFIGWVEAAYDNTAAPSGVTFHEAGSQIDVLAELDGKTYYAVYRVATGMATNINDELTADKIGTTSYPDWSGLADASAAIYAGNSTKSTTYSNSIQIRDSNSSGIVTTTSGGLAKKVTFNWVSGNTSGRVVDIYGKNSAYSSAADLYSADAATQGTKIGSITYNSTTELTISTDYEYIGIRANNGAAYIGSITIQWYGAPMKYQTSPTCSPMVGVESSFSTFTYAYNAGPSASQSFTISGSNLGADLVVTAPANYEVCKTADGTYTSTISYTPSDGAVANTTAYIRLAAGLNVGTYNYAAASGLQVTSTGAKTRTAALNGSVTKADCAITFTDFNAVDHYEATLEYGSRVTVSYNYTYNGDGNFSISHSPATGTIDKANKTLTVSAAGIWTLNASATAGTNYSKPSDASAQIRVKCVDTYKDFIHNKTIKAYGSGTAVTDGKMEDWGSGYTVPYIDDNAEETSGSCQQTHYKFMGWVSEDDINIADGTFKTGWTLIQAGTESKLATTKTYYAVWAKLEE